MRRYIIGALQISVRDKSASGHEANSSMAMTSYPRQNGIRREGIDNFQTYSITTLNVYRLRYKLAARHRWRHCKMIALNGSVASPFLSRILFANRNRY
ncbi:Uncharacterized protein APZ42_016888 [Daphnia magna]|uniref:Uncharacterized protein n=1 Tax=Daphnia magna TaxID=35525 RepID=A0A165A7V3_9CRUS|nr:Uncharacterized protein APZ42_016888 [Daphnia magna]